MGYRQDIKTAGMTNLLYYGIAVEGALRGKTTLHMGGGVTGDENDPLFRFKASLSPEKTIFWLGTRCHDRFQYDELGRIWAASGRQLGGIWGPLETSGTPGSHGRDCLKIIVLDIW